MVSCRIMRRKFFWRDLIWISAQPNLRAAKGLGDPTPTKSRACVRLMVGGRRSAKKPTSGRLHGGETTSASGLVSVSHSGDRSVCLACFYTPLGDV